MSAAPEWLVMLPYDTATRAVHAVALAIAEKRPADNALVEQLEALELDGPIEVQHALADITCAATHLLALLLADLLAEEDQSLAEWLRGQLADPDVEGA